VTVEAQENRPDRKQYAITEQGLARLREWLTQPIAWQVGRDELLLKLYFGRHVDLDVSLQHLRDFRAQHLAQLTRLDAITERVAPAAGALPDTPFWVATITYGQQLSRCMIAWCDETLALLENTRREGENR
jgi:hypothetical protein